METQMLIGSNPWALGSAARERLLPAQVWIDHCSNTTTRA
jgi:hypothetical protein